MLAKLLEVLDLQVVDGAVDCQLVVIFGKFLRDDVALADEIILSTLHDAEVVHHLGHPGRGRLCFKFLIRILRHRISFLELPSVPAAFVESAALHDLLQ